MARPSKRKNLSTAFSAEPVNSILAHLDMPPEASSLHLRHLCVSFHCRLQISGIDDDHLSRERRRVAGGQDNRRRHSPIGDKGQIVERLLYSLDRVSPSRLRTI